MLKVEGLFRKMKICNSTLERFFNSQSRLSPVVAVALEITDVLASSFLSFERLPLKAPNGRRDRNLGVKAAMDTRGWQPGLYTVQRVHKPSLQYLCLVLKSISVPDGCWDLFRKGKAALSIWLTMPMVTKTAVPICRAPLIACSLHLEIWGKLSPLLVSPVHTHILCA